MAQSEGGASPWLWILGAIVLIGLAAYLASVVPEDTDIQKGSTQEVGAQERGSVVGVWRSSDDAKFTREFGADGTIVDRYEGDDSATAVGTWMVVDPAQEPQEALGAPAENLAGMTVLKLTFSDGVILYAAVNALTETELRLINVSGRGNILSFTKVQ